LKRNNVLLVVVSLMLSLLAAEIGLRIGGIAYPEFNRLDPLLGWSPRPGIEGIYAIEGRTHISINSEGFRDIDHARDKAGHVLRVAVLGDSLAEGREVALKATFWKVMENGLSACLRPEGMSAEVLGFAVNGYGTAQQVLVLEHRVEKYAPDVVLLAAFTGNDIANNSRAIDGHPGRPYFWLESGSLRLENEHLRTASFRMKRLWTDIKHGAFNALRSVQVMRQAYSAMKARLKYRDLSVADQLTAGLSGKLYRAPEDEAWQNAWAITEALMARAAESSRKMGARFVLTTLSNPIQVTPDLDLRVTAAQELGVDDLLYPDRRLASFGRNSGFEVIALAERLAARAVGGSVRFHGRESFAGGHWNENGHRVAGEILAQELCDILR
tara:strand:+ start:5409 stop:6560 length:1152 start_codon:yes stop_codon:yes gene_type:complete